jgi:putative transposase
MKVSKVTDAQKASILRHGADDGISIAEICRKAGISQSTYFNWRKRYNGLRLNEMQRLRQLQDENSKLKKLVADLSLDRKILQDVMRRKF